MKLFGTERQHRAILDIQPQHVAAAQHGQQFMPHELQTGRNSTEDASSIFYVYVYSK